MISRDKTFWAGFFLAFLGTVLFSDWWAQRLCSPASWCWDAGFERLETAR